MAESSSFPGITWVIGSWYAPDELCKRVTVFEQSANIGTMSGLPRLVFKLAQLSNKLILGLFRISGYLQAAVYKSMDGKCNLKGWQWLFLIIGSIFHSFIHSLTVLAEICALGIMSIPTGLLGLICVPDTPSTTRAFWLRPKGSTPFKSTCSFLIFFWFFLF